jgi:hypothetical protein
VANFSPSNLVKAQALLKQRFNEAELRRKQSAALAVAMKNQDLLIPGHQQLRTREDRTVEAYIMKRTSRTTGTARAYNHTGTRGDSMAVALTWSRFSDVFTLSLKMMDNNIFSFEQALANSIYNTALNLHSSIETAGINYLKANRTQVNAGGPSGSFNGTNFAYEIALANKPRYSQIAMAMMNKNKYVGAVDVIASPEIYLDAQFYASQGTNNATNYGFQFAGLNYIQSIELADSNYAAGVSMVIPEGLFGVLPWIPKQNREGSGDYNSVLGGYGSIPDPLGTGLDYALHAYAQRADTSASNGDTQDVVMEFELSIDIAWLTAPLSVANETPIFEVAQLSA